MINTPANLLKFLNAARNLAKQGLKEKDILAFAKQEFGEVTDLVRLQINKIFKTKNQPSVGIKTKDPVFDNTVETIPFDDTGTPFNPRDPQKVYGKPREGIKTLDEAEMDIKSIDDATNELNDAVTEADAFSESIGFPAATKKIKKETSDLDDILEGLEGDKSLPEIDENLLKNFNDEIKAGVDEIMSDTSPAALKKSIEVDNLMLEYPGLSRDFAKQIANDPDPESKARILFMVKKTFELDKQGKSGDEIIDIFKGGKTGDETLDNSIILNNFDPKGRKPSAMGGRIGYGTGTPSKNRFTQLMLLKEEALEKGDMDKVRQIQSDIDKEFGKANGGRIGYADGTENMMAEIDYSSSAYRFKLIDSLMDTGGLDYGSAVKEADRIIEIKLRPKTKKKLAAGGLPNILGY